jgi:hypothetical protein
MLVSAHYQFLKVVKCAIIFPRLLLSYPTPTQAGSAHHITSLHQAEVK